jgi:hypothetical protein
VGGGVFYIHRDKLDNYNLNLQSVIEVLKSQGVDIKSSPKFEIV